MNPYIKGSYQTPTFYNHFCEMLGHVFTPTSTPLKAQAYVVTNIDARLIGADKKYQFHAHIKNMSKEKISIQENDFYVNVKITSLNLPLALRVIEVVLKKIFYFLQPSKPSICDQYLPSTLFDSAKENDVIFYYKDEQLIELTLKQKTHDNPQCQKNFEDFLDSLKKSTEWNRKTQVTPIYYQEDIPEDTLHLDTRVLGKETVVYIGNNNKTILSKEHLPIFEKYRSAEPFGYIEFLEAAGSPKRFHLDAPGMSCENFSTIVDDHFIFITGERVPPNPCISRTSPSKLALTLTTSHNHLINKNSFKIEILANGIACVRFDLKKISEL